jgi:hypothetical protein
LSLFAALNIATGEVLGMTAPRHTSAEGRTSVPGRGAPFADAKSPGAGALRIAIC